MHEQQDHAVRDVARWPWLLAVLTLLLGLSISFWARATQSRIEQRRLEDEFVVEAEHLRGRVEREVRLFLGVLNSIRDLHDLSEGIRPKDFEEFVVKGMDHQREILGGFGFAQFIPPALRASYESDPSSRILERDPDSPPEAPAYRPARDRAGWYPLTYQYPPDALGVPVGYDFGSTSEGREALASMALSGRQALDGTPPSIDDAEQAHWVFAPIFFGGQPRGPPAGFAIALFQAHKVLARVTTGPSAEGLRFDLGAFADDAAAERPWTFIAPIPVADRIRTFRCEAEPRYLQTHRSHKPEWIFGIGLLTTLVVTAFFMSMALRAHRIERTVQARTAALHRANAKLQDEMRERGRLESELVSIGRHERARLGRDLHDSLGQKLTGAVYLSRALTQPDEAEHDATTARELNVLLKDAVAQVRRIARGLAPVDLGDEGLTGALQGLVQDTNTVRPGLCALTEQNAETLARMEASRATQLFHIAQEAVTNALRHAGATHIGIALDAQGDRCMLTVDDDGKGLDETGGKGHGMGLSVMRHRAQMIGGTLSIENRPEGGLRVRCVCPL